MEENVRPTKKQKELLIFLDGFIKGNGYGPSYREIMRALDYKSVSTVAAHIKGLVQKGWVEKTDNSARSLVVVYASETPAVKEIKSKIKTLKAEENPKQSDIEALERALDLLK